MKNKTIQKLILPVLPVFTILFSACAPNDTLPPPAVPFVQSVCENPVIIAAAPDQSGSMKWSGTPPISPADFKPLLDLIGWCGGEIGVTFVRSDSAKPIERFRVEEPPLPPVKPVRNEDDEDYEFADRSVEFDGKLSEWNMAVKERHSAIQPKIEDYLNKLKPLLEHEPKGSTDLWSAVYRLDVFLREGDATWRAKPHRYLIIISDARDTVGRPQHEFMSDAVIFWVNGNASDKEFDGFAGQRFESFQAGVAEIIAREERSKKDAERK